MPSKLPTPLERDGASWSDVMVQALRNLWSAGLTAAAVARELGVSRNAVLGKVHRLGLESRRKGRPPKPRRPARRKPAVTPPHAPKRQIPRFAEMADAVGEPLVAHLADLAPRTCHWPFGDPQSADFGFCGRPADGGCYCAPHWTRSRVAARQVDPLSD